MSKRHTSSRRRTYGRRQHEIHERIERIAERRRTGRAWRESHSLGLDAVSYLDGQGTHQPFGYPD